MDKNELVARRIMEARERKRLYQKDMAAALDISVNAYNCIENGKTKITINVLYKIAEILEVPVSRLLDIKEENTPSNNNSFIISQNINGTLYFQASEEQTKRMMKGKL